MRHFGCQLPRARVYIDGSAPGPATLARAAGPRASVIPATKILPGRLPPLSLPFLRGWYDPTKRQPFLLAPPRPIPTAAGPGEDSGASESLDKASTSRCKGRLWKRTTVVGVAASLFLCPLHSSSHLYPPRPRPDRISFKGHNFSFQGRARAPPSSAESRHRFSLIVDGQSRLSDVSSADNRRGIISFHFSGSSQRSTVTQLLLYVFVYTYIKNFFFLVRHT